MPVKQLFAQYIILFTLQLFAAMLCGPHSCEWGNTVYFFMGIACMVIAFTLYISQTKCKLQKRLVMSTLMLLLSAVFWCACFILFDFRIMCALF
jgi:hypothetical protein